ncbi:MAG: hypothetical protein IBX50_09765 [Marinospirillum sp.]|uniref:HTH domain-containing protein n=1 Tax=Marinospirillum sp. TaxID=2183934 RepID=UPI0019F545D5|nr:HTH domain-containing protein [Marinospirillum sp.]MBE0506989.1 hypothetical protein [Marinospirillum sp.]
MTIVEAIKEVLKNYPEGLTAGKIYDEIVKRKLYTFGAVDPKQVVRSKLRKHCVGLDFPSASPTKHFMFDGGKGKTIKYSIWDGELESKDKIEPARPDRLPEEVVDINHKEHVSQVKN